MTVEILHCEKLLFLEKKHLSKSKKQAKGYCAAITSPGKKGIGGDAEKKKEHPRKRKFFHIFLKRRSGSALKGEKMKMPRRDRILREGRRHHKKKKALAKGKRQRV